MTHSSKRNIGSANRHHSLLRLAAIAVLVLLSGAASAASGTIVGTLKFYQAQGGYCDVPAGMPGDKNGTGDQTCDIFSLYSEQEFGTFVPVSGTKLYVLDNSGAQVGAGVTDAFGNFTIAWNRPSVPASVYVSWRLEDANNAFRVVSDIGDYWNIGTALYSVCNGCTTNIGTQQVGIPGTPHPLANIYNGAARTYYNSFIHSNRLLMQFTSLEIRAPSTRCPTGCAEDKKIWLPYDAWNKPQARISHEMGHVASYVANPRRLMTYDYCYPSTMNYLTKKCSDNSTPSHSYDSLEYRGVALEEGRATFYGDTAFYWPPAADPRTCNSAVGCPTSGRLETTITCSGKLGRSARQVERFIWDTFDSVGDPGWFDFNARTIHDIVNATTFLPSGYNTNQSESPFANATWTIDAPDSFSPDEFRAVALANPGINMIAEYNANCMAFY